MGVHDVGKLKSLAHIVAYSRTPIGSFLGCLAHFSPTQLGGFAAQHCLQQAGLPDARLDHVVYGQAILSGFGCNSSSTVLKHAGITVSQGVLTVSQNFSTGIRAIVLASLYIANGSASRALAVGAESSSSCPYLVPSIRCSVPKRLGHLALIDSMLHDGFADSVSQKYISLSEVAKKLNVSAERQSNYLVTMKQRAALANIESLALENVVRLPARQTELTRVQSALLKDELFHREGERAAPTREATSCLTEQGPTDTIASPLTDGAAACLLLSSREAKHLSIPPIGQVLSVGEAHAETIALLPEAILYAIQRAVRSAGHPKVDMFEIEDALPAVCLTVIEALRQDMSRINPRGGSVAWGFAAGMAGARLLTSVMATLRSRHLSVGCVVSYDLTGNAVAALVRCCN